MIQNAAAAKTSLSNPIAPTQPSAVLDRVLVLEMVRVTEAAAISASTMIGRGDEKAADAAAVGFRFGVLRQRGKRHCEEQDQAQPGQRPRRKYRQPEFPANPIKSRPATFPPARKML